MQIVRQIMQMAFWKSESQYLQWQTYP